MGHSNKIGTLAHIFLFVLLPCLDRPHMQKMMALKEMEKQGNPVACLFHLPFLESKPQVAKVCISKESRKTKTVELVLCSFSTMVRIKYACMHELQKPNCVISVIRHTSQMLLYLHVKLSLHNIKMNGEIHANNLKF